MSQTEFHVTKQQLELLAEDHLSPAERRDVVRHLTTGCSACRALANQIFRRETDYSSAFRNLDAARPATPGGIEAERRLSDRLWQRYLDSANAAERLLLVRSDPRLATWGLFDKVLTLAKERRKDLPFEALDLAYLALEIAQRLDGPKVPGALRNDFIGSTLAEIGNVKRILGDLEGCAEALDRAEGYLEEGTGDPLEEANLISMRVSLLSQLGQLEEGEGLLETALECARLVRDTQLEGKLLIQHSSMIGWLNPLRGLDLAYRALALLIPGADHHLDLCGRYQLIILNCELGNIQESRALFNTFSEDFRAGDNAFWRGRLLQFEAAVARREGDLDAAEDVFRQQVDHFGKHDMRFDLTMATLDLAEVLTAKREFQEALAILMTVFPILEGWNVNSDVLRAWLMVQEAVRVESLEAATFKEATNVLRRYWGNR